MPEVTRLVLDVLKPHKPTSLELATAVAELGGVSRVAIKVEEMDEKTETVSLVIHGSKLDFDGIVASLSALGASLHSIDEVEVNDSAEQS
jgi:hypothetical protein